MIVNYTCIVCDKNCTKSRSKGNMITQPKFCSQKCSGFYKSLNRKGKTPNFEIECLSCKVVFKTYRSPSNSKNAPKFCSLKCLGASQRGERNPAYNGGRYINNGYYTLFLPDHPYASKKGNVLEHRVVMEKKIGRYLKPEEVVHHIDKNGLNNNPENLMLFINQSEHIKHHAKIKSI